MCLKGINPKVNTRTKVSNHPKVKHMFKEREMYLSIINPTLNPVMVLNILNLLWVSTPE